MSLKLEVAHKLIAYTSSSPDVLHGSQGVRDQFPRDPWTHLRNDSFEDSLFLKFK